MPARTPHVRRGQPHDFDAPHALGRLHATRASLVEAQLCIQASRAAIARSYALLGDREPRPSDPDAAAPAMRNLALSPPRDAADPPDADTPDADTPDADTPDADDLRHRTIDGLQLVLGLIERRLHRAEGAEAREALAALLGDVSALGAVQRRFAGVGPDGPANGVAGVLADLGEAWQRLAADRGVAVEVETEPVEAGERQATALALAANELVTNSLKHASQDGRHGRVRVGLRGDGEGWGALHIADDGRGLVDGAGPESLGLEAVAALLRRVGAELHLGGAGATRATVRFPLAGHAGPDGGASDGAPHPPRPA